MLTENSENLHFYTPWKFQKNPDVFGGSRNGGFRLFSRGIKKERRAVLG